MPITQSATAAGHRRAVTVAVEPEGAETWVGEWTDPERADHAFAEHVGEGQMTWQILPPLSTRTAHLVLALLGLLSAHQFYLRNGCRGGLYLLTAGGLGIGLVIDLCTLSQQVKTANGLRALGPR